jgi:putative heme-binding domain-containing protein
LLASSGKQHPELNSILAKAAGLGTGSMRLGDDQTQELIRQVREQGDASRGAEIFQRPELGCVVCHSLGGQGGNIGPDLSALGTAQPLDFILGAILDPQKEIKEGYSALNVVTKDGEEYQGYLVRESTDELVLRDIVRNQEVRLRKSAIQDRRSGGSVMPAGLADTLTRVEFRDLLRFLSEQGTAK